MVCKREAAFSVVRRTLKLESVFSLFKRSRTQWKGLRLLWLQIFFLVAVVSAQGSLGRLLEAGVMLRSMNSPRVQKKRVKLERSLFAEQYICVSQVSNSLHTP